LEQINRKYDGVWLSILAFMKILSHMWYHWRVTRLH
jgi:hypothetical protein